MKINYIFLPSTVSLFLHRIESNLKEILTPAEEAIDAHQAVQQSKAARCLEKEKKAATAALKQPASSAAKLCLKQSTSRGVIT